MVLSVVSFGDVTSQLTQQAEKRVRQESKAMGMAIYQRLLVLESELRSLSAQGTAPSDALSSDTRPADERSVPRFLGTARVTVQGTTNVVSGEVRSIPPLSSAQWAILKSRTTLLMVEKKDSASRRVFLASLASGMTDEQAILAEVNVEYLWGLSGNSGLPDDMTICVFGEAGDTLACTASAPDLMKEHRTRLGEGGVPTFEWSDERDSFIAGSWTIPLRFQFSAAPWTVVLSEPRSSVLAPLASFKYRFSLVVLIAVLCVALLSVNQIRKTMVPLEELGEGTRRIARRDFSTPVRVESGDEFEELATSFNAMTTRLSQQFTQLATIHEIDRSVLSLLDPSRIVDTVLARLRAVSPCEAIAVLLLDPSESGRGWFYARLGRDRAETTMEGVSVSEAERGLLMECRDYVPLAAQAASGTFAKLCIAGVESLLVLPLFRSHDLLGGIALGYRHAPDMKDESALQLRQLADQVAVALSNASDLAERKRAEASLRESNIQLESALTDLKTTQQQMVQQERLRALGQMASGIAHDFNNTLSPIVGFSELLLIDPRGLDNHDTVKEYLQTINLAAKDAAKVVSRLRDFYRPRLDADLSGMVDVNRLVEQIVKLSQPKWKDQALANGVAIDLQIDLDVVPPVVGHESELREVLTNLVFNAVDAMPKNGAITLRTKADGEYVRLEVSDSGTGMTEEVRQRCLEPFFSTKGEKGTGLGLAMVYGIIRRLRGTIDITSEVGTGTTFRIRLPIQSDPHAGQQVEGANLTGVQLQVLVVDDDPLVGRVTSEYLRVAGHRVEFVGSAAEAIKTFTPERVHVVVTDHGMPQMTGRQLAEVIKKVSPDTAVVLLTGGDQTDADEAPSAAVDVVLSKPLTMASLQQALSRITIRNLAQAENRKEIGEAA
ncbi:MAG: protein of unknown function, putative Histidine kinase [Nitrospira sp.]|nr:protein of unknown function, putative Histidine kinase [Nitrospira sp.]